MKRCLYCEAPMANPRRVQCGSEECRRKYNNDRVLSFQRAYKAKHGHWYNKELRKKFPRTCVHCGATWRATSKDARYCSFACQAAHQHGAGRNRKTTPAQRRRAAARRRLERAARGTRGRTPWVSGRCSECGALFATPQPSARTCSASCAEARRKARYQPYISPPARLAIYKRDAWTCQLCLTAVDPDLHYLDDWAATLDHIVCRSWSEEPDHSPQNLRLAHRWCNSVRGNESVYDARELAELMGVSA